MKYNRFSKSDQQVSLLGYGGWGIGKQMWGGADDKESMKSLLTAIEKGVNFFDSAAVYGGGHSEKLIAEAERQASKDIFITSKVPSKKMEWPAYHKSKLSDSFPEQYIIDVTERSLSYMKRDHLDLQQFHVWNDKWAEQDEWKNAIYKLKKSGKVRFFGISINDHQAENGIEAGKSGLIDSYQVIFNIFDQSPADKLLSFCKENNISIIARVPFDEGSLTGAITPQTEFEKGDFRSRYFRDDRKQQVWERIEKLQEVVKGETGSLAEAALRYLASFDAVTTIIPGMRKHKNLLANIESIAKGPLSNGLLEQLKDFRWERNFYQ
jgi:aryl-alcohol dehydrogenase-like predicted oxidoreductase